MEWIRHPSVMASTGALVVLTAAEVASDVPWWVWATWAGLSAVAVAQAVRKDEA